jgi:hypothetical protein
MIPAPKVPKGGDFVTEGERAEFRATLSDHAGKDALSEKFFANRRDWKRARRLLFVRGDWVSAWRPLPVGRLRDGIHLDGFSILWVERCEVRA